MSLQPVEPAQLAEVVPPLRRGLDSAPHEVASLHGASATGEAARRELCIRIGLWLDEQGAIRHARWRTVEDPMLRSFAEAACALLETGTDPLGFAADALRGAVPAAATSHGDRAELVIAAVHAAFGPGGWRA